MTDTNDIECPICGNVDGGSCTHIVSSEPGLTETMFKSFECSICGLFNIDLEAYNRITNGRGITKIQRALISHRVRIEQGGDIPMMISRAWLDHIVQAGTLPSPIEQAHNLVRYIGDKVSKTGEDIQALPNHIHAIIGAVRLKAAIDLARELRIKGWLRLNPEGAVGHIGNDKRPASFPTDINLTLDGWEQYMDEKSGRFAGDYGFLAMEFNNSELEAFVEEVLKPAVKEALGYDLRDIRDISRAGIIDNILRVAIRDARFVIVDLTHDNNGAYCEAGYAEGLDKPVVYICEKEKFERSKEEGGGTHFDTNHCTTVLWGEDGNKDFRQQLAATLRNSLDLA